jgi:hypothetical protein
VPRTCTICRHVERATIDKALVRRKLYRDIVQRFSVSKDILSRHIKEHVAPPLAKVCYEEDIHIDLDVNAAIQETVEAKGG